MKYLLGIITIVLLASCSVKKRTYRDGYYIDWAFNKKTNPPLKKVEPSAHITRNEKEEIPVEIVSSKGADKLSDLILTDNKEVLLMDTCGDVITFKSGDQVVARVTEITDDKIKYKRCDNLDGPVFVVNKSTVATVKYSNGVVEKIEVPAVEQYSSPNNGNVGNKRDTYRGPQKLNTKALLSLLSFIFLGWLYGIGILISYFLAIYAIKEIRTNPDKYKGLVLAKVMKVICLIIFGLVVLGVLLNNI